MNTRSQQLMLLAENLVSDVNSRETVEVKNTYGNLCFSFPVLVRQSGLCQAIAFSIDKAESEDASRAKAHRCLIDHVAKVLKVPADELGGRVAEMDLASYMLSTRVILRAWVYFKRFAVSILKVK